MKPTDRIGLTGFGGARTTNTMKPGGFYAASTPGAKAVVDSTIPMVLDCASRIALPATGPVVLVDYGAADGGNSADLVRAVIRSLRRRAPATPIQVVYTDLPDNDYCALFRWLHSETGYLAEYAGVFAAAAGTSFYQQVLPDATVHIGFSATAMHWLSHKPGDIAGHVHANSAGGAAAARFRDRAAADWESILTYRARELVPGGVLVTANLCVDQRGRYVGRTEHVDVFDTFARLWLGLRRDGLLTDREYERATFAQYYRSPEDFMRPLRDPDSSASRAGLRLIRGYVRTVPCPLAAAHRVRPDAVQLADGYIAALRSWSEGVFLGALDGSRPAAQRYRVVDELYARYHREVLCRPDHYALDYVHCYLAIERDRHS